MTIQRDYRHLRSSVCRVAAALVVLMAGCGSELYEQRLENTRRLFQHMELLDSHLTGEWSDAGSGLRIRPPRQFQMIPAPAPRKKSAEEPDVSDVDPRQPPYLNVELPGLRAAFIADLGAVNEGKPAPTSGYMYVLSNHVVGKKGPGDNTAKFGENVVTILCEALHMSARPEDWQTVVFPSRRDVFVNPLEYRQVMLSPQDLVLPLKDGHDRLQSQFAIYIYKQGEVQVVVLFVFPRDYNSDEQLDKRIPLSLETLGVEGDSAIRQAAPAAGGNAPAGGAGGAPAAKPASF